VEDAMEDSLDNAGAEDHSLSLAAKLEAQLHIPVRTTDFTRARAFAESWHNTLVQKRRVSFFYIELGMELDCVAIRKSLMDPLSCEFGACHITALNYEEDGKCVTVESLLSGTVTLERAAKILGRETDFKEMKALAIEGHKDILKLMHEYGYWLGCALALVVNMAGLRKVILGGALADFWPFFEKSMWQGIESHIAGKLKGNIKVRVIDDRFADGIKGSVAKALDWWIFQTDLLYSAMPAKAGVVD
jgi:predicted NBD/HSP70 family sugar kinase